MKFKDVSDTQLLTLAKEKSKTEKTATLEVIEILKEVESRRLYLKLGYGSLFEFATRELGYDESAALRRISAARLTREIPEIKKKVADGELSLSALTQAQVFFRKEENRKSKKLSKVEKIKVLNLLENKSSRGVQKELVKLSPETALMRETWRPVSESHTEIKIVIDEALIKKLEKLKCLLSHKYPAITYAELISELADLALKKLDPAEKVSGKGHLGMNSQYIKSQEPKSQCANKTSPPATPQVQNESSRYVSTTLRQEVWTRDRGTCTFQDPITGKRCSSRYQLQYHHVIPFGKGGPTTAQNIKLLCRKHNQLMAIQDYGTVKMIGYLPNFGEVK